MTITCSACGAELEIGDYPFCPHGSVFQGNARGFDPIVVWESNAEPGKFSFPGQSGERVPEGYHKIEITNMRQADRFVGRMNDQERQKLEAERDLRYMADDMGVRTRRAEEDARGYAIRADGTKFYIRGNTRAENLQRAARAWADKIRERRRAAHARIDPQFHNNALSFDSGSRNSYSGPETGWRERKS